MRWFFAACDVMTALLVLVGAFAGLPARWWPIDAAAVLVACCLGGAAVLLALGRGAALVRTACGVVLACGIVLASLLAVSAAHLSGIYGPVGRGGALVFVLVAALVLPYLVALPAAQLVWLRGVKKTDTR